MYLGGLMGLTPSFHSGNGQSLADASRALQAEPISPDYDSDAEFIEREVFLGE